MKTDNIQSFLAAMLCTTVLCVSAQTFGEVANATLDAVREASEQASAPAHIKAIFNKAKNTKSSGGVDFCGFYVGMDKADATALVEYYGLSSDDWSFDGDPLVHSIHFSLSGIRKVMKGGNSFKELCQGVANRVGDLQYVNDFLEGEKWEYKTIDGIVVKIRENKTVGTMNLVKAFTMEDTTGKIKDASDSLLRYRQSTAKKNAEKTFNAASVSIQELPLMEVSLPTGISMRFRQLPNGLWFGETEVTQEQWTSLIPENPSKLKWPTRPVDNVSWAMCNRFVEKFRKQAEKMHTDLVFRLPEPDEWLYACKAEGTGDYFLAANGNEVTSETIGIVAWIESNSDDQTHPVGKKMANAWGLYDMLGNVAEWGPKDDSKNGDRYFLYGDSYISSEVSESKWNARSSSDGWPHGWTGFRLCASSKTEEARKKAEQEELQKGKAAEAIALLISNMVVIPDRKYTIGRYEVTQGQWFAIMGNNPSERKGDDLPVESITWNDCQRFLKKLNARPESKSAKLRFRLPTAEEWWYACHAGSSDKMGDISCYLDDGTAITEKTLDRVFAYMPEKFYGATSGKELFRSHTVPVGRKEPNAFGLYDMFGNVREMVNTECGEVDDNASAFEHIHICCGGSWKEKPYRTVWARYGINSTDSYDDVGFRLCAETLSPGSVETNDDDSSNETLSIEKEEIADTFAEEFGLSQEELDAIDGLSRIVDFDTLLKVNQGDMEDIINKISVRLAFLRSMRTLSILEHIKERTEVELLFGRQKKTMVVSSKEDAYQGIEEFLKALPNSAKKIELLTMLGFSEN